MKKTKMNLAKTAALGLLLGSLGLIACNKSGGGGDAAPATTTTVVTVSCNGCNDLGGANLLTGVTGVTPDQNISFMLNVVGSAAFVMSDPTQVAGYGGPAIINGNMHVAAVDPVWCNMPVGDYAIAPMTASIMSWGMIQGGAYQATGPIAVQFTMISGTFYNQSGLNAASPNNRVGMDIFLNSVNGQPCGYLSTY